MAKQRLELAPREEQYLRERMGLLRMRDARAADRVKCMLDVFVEKRDANLSEIAVINRVSLRSLVSWIRIFRACRLRGDAFGSLPRGGRRGSLEREQEQMFLEATIEFPHFGPTRLKRLLLSRYALELPLSVIRYWVYRIRRCGERRASNQSL